MEFCSPTPRSLKQQSIYLLIETYCYYSEPTSLYLYSVHGDCYYSEPTSLYFYSVHGDCYYSEPTSLYFYSGHGDCYYSEPTSLYFYSCVFSKEAANTNFSFWFDSSMNQTYDQLYSRRVH